MVDLVIQGFNMKSNTKTILLTIVSIFGLFIFCLFGVKGCENSARSREKIVETQIDNISIEQENLFNTLSTLSQNIKYGIENEKEFQMSIAELRGGNAAKIDGNIQTFIAAVHENPPVWMSNELLKDMNLAIQKYNENVAKSKKSYRKAVENYEYFVEKWPNKSILSMQNYNIKEYEHFNDGTSLKIETKKLEKLY